MWSAVHEILCSWYTHLVQITQIQCFTPFCAISFQFTLTYYSHTNKIDFTPLVVICAGYLRIEQFCLCAQCENIILLAAWILSVEFSYRSFRALWTDLQTLSATTNAQYYILYISLLICSYMFRHSCPPQGAYTNVVNVYSNKIFLQ